MFFGIGPFAEEVADDSVELENPDAQLEVESCDRKLEAESRRVKERSSRPPKEEAKEEGELGERPSSECWWDRVASRRPPKEDAREEGELALGDPYWRDAGAPEKE